MSEMVNDERIVAQNEARKSESPKNELIPTSRKDFNEFIKDKGFTGRSHYTLKELNAIFGFKPLTYKNQTVVNIDDGKQFKVYESISKPSIGSGIPYTTSIQAKKKYKSNPGNPVNIRYGGNTYIIKFNNTI